MCKIRIYFHMLSTDLSFQMLLFASINRYFSSRGRKRRQNHTHCLIKHFCNQPNVYKLCIISSIIFALLSLQHVFNFTISSPSERCIPHNPILWGVWISSIHCFLLPILMIVFGILTLRYSRYTNCLQHFHGRKKNRKHRFIEMCAHCARSDNSVQYQIDRQLTSMIISEIFVTVLTSLPYGTYAFYHLLLNVRKITITRPYESLWIPLLIRLTMYFEPSCGFYIYLLTLSTLRKRFMKQITGIDFGS